MGNPPGRVKPIRPYKDKKTLDRNKQGRSLQEQGKRALTANKNYRHGPSLKRRWSHSITFPKYILIN